MWCTPLEFKALQMKVVLMHKSGLIPWWRLFSVKNTNNRATRVLHIGGKCLSQISQLFCHIPLTALMSFSLWQDFRYHLTFTQLYAETWSCVLSWSWIPHAFSILRQPSTMVVVPCSDWIPVLPSHTAQILSTSFLCLSRKGLAPGLRFIKPKPLLGKCHIQASRTLGALQHYLQLQHPCTRMRMITCRQSGLKSGSPPSCKHLSNL